MAKTFGGSAELVARHCDLATTHQEYPFWSLLSGSDGLLRLFNPNLETDKGCLLVPSGPSNSIALGSCSDPAAAAWTGLGSLQGGTGPVLTTTTTTRTTAATGLVTKPNGGAGLQVSAGGGMLLARAALIAIALNVA